MYGLQGNGYVKTERDENFVCVCCQADFTRIQQSVFPLFISIWPSVFPCEKSLLWTVNFKE
jgi:hypothetical protein